LVKSNEHSERTAEVRFRFWQSTSDFCNRVTHAPRTLLKKSGTLTLGFVAGGAAALLYIDLHLVHEVTSPQA